MLMPEPTRKLGWIRAWPQDEELAIYSRRESYNLGARVNLVKWLVAFRINGTSRLCI